MIRSCEIGGISVFATVYPPIISIGESPMQGLRRYGPEKCYIRLLPIEWHVEAVQQH